MKNCCDRIDDYLDGDLSDEEQEDWIALARECLDCQEVLRQQQQVDRLLKTACELIDTPKKELPAVDAVAPAKLSARSLIVALLALAASVGFIFVLRETFIERKEPTPRPPVEVVSVEPISSKRDVPAIETNASETIVTSRSGLVVPIASNSEFTIVQVVPEFVRTNDSHSSK